MTGRGYLRAGVVLGALLACAPVVGMFGTMFGMHMVFQHLGKDGIADPHALSNTIGGMLLLTTGGLALCPCGIVLLIVCALRLQRPHTSQPPPLPRLPET